MRVFWIIVAVALVPHAALAQVFVTGLGGFAVLSNAAAASASPVSASNYDSKPGLAINVAAGYHLTDWFSFQAGYIWNRNRIITTEVAGPVFRQSEQVARQAALGADFLIYFRPRTSHIRPYLSGGPAWVRVFSQNKLGFRTTVGAELLSNSGLGFRYSFSEMVTGNPLAGALSPPSHSKLMNFQNLFGFVKVF